MDRHAHEAARGDHTLRLWQGTIVDIRGDDVFVDLGPRRQGVISLRAFEVPPQLDEVYDFTLRGREDELWALALPETRALDAWAEMEEGSLVSGRVMRATPDGLQLKVGPLHAFMPKSQSGAARGHKYTELVGRTLPVEVLHVDDDKQRIVVSHKAFLQQQRLHGGEGNVVPGMLVQGRIFRIEDYGVFVRFGRASEGLVHASNLALDRPAHPAELFKVGDSVDALVLTVRAGGKRIGLGLKQLLENPWKRAAREFQAGQLVEVLVVRVRDFGAFVRLAPGVEGLLPASECPGANHRKHLTAGATVTVRVVRIDEAEERAAFSLMHEGGAPVQPGAASDRAAFEARRAELAGEPATTPLGRLLRAALEAKPRASTA
ncbi:MAG: S1 RNA-binding domain-containing protein [Planctomycetota bacterium]